MANSTIVGRTRRKAVRVGADGTHVVADEVISQAHTSTDTKVGSKNPNWKANIRRVVQAGSAYSRSGTSYGFVTGNITGRYRIDFHQSTVTDTMTGALFLDNGPSLPVMPPLPNLDVGAKTEFLSKCRQTYRAFQGGVFLGELAETIRMIARPGAALRTGISAYLADTKKVGRRTSFTDRGRILTKTWLEHSYGWRPLISEIDAGMAALASTSHLIPEVIAGVGKTTFYGDRVVRTTNPPGSFVAYNAAFMQRTDASVRYLGAVAWESENRARDWKSHWGLSVSDFYPTVWNLIPYSFIVDYFSNIGAVIDASSFGSVGLRWGVRSSRVKSYIDMAPLGGFFSSSSALNPRRITASLALTPLSTWTFSRSLIDNVTVGLGDIQFRVPGVTDWRKWANLSALAIERLY
jgi:hypothetical protein